MKKALIVLLVVVLAIASFFVGKNIGARDAVIAFRENAEAEAAEEAAEAPAPAEEEAEAVTDETAETVETVETVEEAEPTPEPTLEPTPSVELDFDKLHALHAPEDVIMAIDGADVTWGDYFYSLYNQAGRISSTLQQMAMYYGMAVSWDDPFDEEGSETIADLAVTNSLEMFKQQKAVADFCEENGIALSAEDEAAVKQEIEDYFKQYLGEDVTEEKIDETLSKMYLTREQFEDVNKLSKLYELAFEKQYGKNGRKVSTQKAVKYLEDNGYLAAAHILFMTVDPSTREALDEEAIAEKKALAEETLAKLQAVEDRDERIALFNELKEQYCEDTGKVSFPDGYLFTPGTMVPEFENAVTALGEYEISGLVESTYGYHIIMRLPLSADMRMDISSDGSDVTARTTLAEKSYAEKIQARMDAMKVENKNGYEAPKLGEFTK